ncbi:MAG: phasin family protein [Rickettsia endosymbiont of Bryobia graminum]|nr:phasin family protein [Rickettsia endosymbiont of Bryobia graminum]
MSEKHTNQFLDMMKNFMNPENYMKAVKDMPAMDFSAISETINKSAKIMTTTNQIAAESLQSMMQKNSEYFQNHTMQMMNAVKEAMSSGDPKHLVELQQKCIKSACENSINNAKEFADMAHDTSGKIIEAMNNITDQVAKNFAKATKKS